MIAGSLQFGSFAEDGTFQLVREYPHAIEHVWAALRAMARGRKRALSPRLSLHLLVAWSRAASDIVGPSDFSWSLR
jgi:hypothetical protein